MPMPLNPCHLIDHYAVIQCGLTDDTNWSDAYVAARTMGWAGLTQPVRLPLLQSKSKPLLSVSRMWLVDGQTGPTQS